MIYPAPLSSLSPPNPHTSHVALVAGEGTLPLEVTHQILGAHLRLSVYALDKKTLKALTPWVPPGRCHFLSAPAMLGQNLNLMKSHGITHLVFVGKVNKWTLLRRPLFDQRALTLWQSRKRFNDDAVMQMLIEELSQNGIETLPQTWFMQGLFAQPGLYTHREPTPREMEDIQFGLPIVREMGRLDIGQTLVVHHGMVIAVEAIEGTDEAIRRAGKWANKQGGVVLKTEKPGQDTRFDVPAVGIRTLKTMSKAGLKVLAVEAHKTLLLDKEAMVAWANRHGQTIVAV